MTCASDEAFGASSSPLWPAGHMERNQYVRDDRYQARLRPQPSTSSLQLSQPTATLEQAPFTSPLPQAHWESVPLPYRPRDWEQTAQTLAPSNNSDSTHTWRLQPTSRTRERRRPAGLGRTFTGSNIDTQGASADVDMAHPQTSSYDAFGDRSFTDPGPDAYRRAFSQPNTPNFDQLQHEPEEPSSTLFPRASTFHSTGRRRDRRATAADTTFVDDADFSLFAQATAGLGPEDAMRQLDTSAGGPHRSALDPAQRPPILRARSERIVSPVEQTPTTMFALHSLAQMPLDLPERRHPQTRRLEIQQLQASMAGINLWVEPPSAITDGEFSPDDEELPDYAASQAQAHASQRAEAARRAAELRRRWEQSR